MSDFELDQLSDLVYTHRVHLRAARLFGRAFYRCNESGVIVFGSTGQRLRLDAARARFLFLSFQQKLHSRNKSH